MTGEIAGYPLPDLPQPCSYLPGRTASFEHYQLVSYDDEAFCALLERGFRHFGSYFFRPACPGPGAERWCGACVPIRIPVERFRPSRSQRRALRDGAALEMDIADPVCTPEKFALYQRHKERFERTTRDLGLPPAQTCGAEDAESFRVGFYEPSRFTRECTYRLDGRLVAVGLVDIASRAVSSMYFYFDPDVADLSPGTLSVLREIELARALGAAHYYLGYVIEANPSMRYKAAFRPSEVWDGAAWRPFRRGGGRYAEDPKVFRVAPHGRLLG